MSEQENLDLGKVISLIMENPALIEQISSLAKQNQSAEQQAEQPAAPQAEEQTAPPEQKTEPTYSPITHHRNNRAQLLGALKPYVSKERAKAIDSMISIADILDMMKAR